eukprot:Gb_32163 [translate_table: standard]
MGISSMWALDFGALDAPTFSFFKDSHVVAITRVDWKEPESRVFTADMSTFSFRSILFFFFLNTFKVFGEQHIEEVKESDQWH